MTKDTYRAIDNVGRALKGIDLAALTKLEDLEGLLDQAWEDYDAKSERWQDSDAGSEELERIDRLSTLIDCLTEINDLIGDTKRAIEEIENNAPEGAFNP